MKKPDRKGRTPRYTTLPNGTASSPSTSTLLDPLIAQINAKTRQCGHHIQDRCLVEAAPWLQEQLNSELAERARNRCD